MTNPWQKSGWAFKPTSTSQLMTAIARLGTHHSGRRYLWRGQADMNWSLEPSLVRFLRDRGLPHDERAVRTAENALVKAARDWPAPEFAGLIVAQGLLAMLQHQGVKTGLLDFTTDPMTALWFACESETATETQHVSGVLMAVDVTDWRRLDTEDVDAYANWSHLPDPLGQGYMRIVDEGAPFLVVPSRPAGRMSVQRGVLVRAPIDLTAAPFAMNIGVTAKGPVGLADALASPKTRGNPARLPFVALLIDTGMKQTLVRHLGGTYGIERRTLFPEVAGFVEAVRLNQVLTQ